MLDRLTDAAIIGGLALWALASDTGDRVILLAVLARTGAMLSMATKDRISALGLRPTPERRIALLSDGRDGRSLVVAVWALSSDARSSRLRSSR